ncbi:hypothetical protein MLD38_026538 [Melastoma candidum]|uniref:Uncharacterized protein n=1 Tax=Melastoma candidum TaxID=119954 RepID=A0ACB9NZT8_9MYRT|nr:hypothetical protein MLD38_026538 [Melastoma candidum]
MASASPPILPISVPHQSTPVPAATATATEEAAQASALRNLLNNLSATASSALSQRRPWSELLDRSAFSKPESISDATLRLRKNYSYFRLNYLLLVSAFLTLSLLTHPFSLLLLLSLLSAWLFLFLLRTPNSPPLVFLGRTYSDRETLGILIALTAFVLFLTSVGSVIISALFVGVAVVCLHGAFRVPEDLFLDDQEPGAATGFLSFLGGAAPSAAASAAPAVLAAARI